MDKETYEALKLLMEKLDRHVIHATYQEDAKGAYRQVAEWIDEVSHDTYHLWKTPKLGFIQNR